MTCSICARNLSPTVPEELKSVMSEESIWTEKEEVMGCWKNCIMTHACHYAELILTVVLWFRTRRLILCGDNKSVFRVELVYFIMRNIYCRVRSPSHSVLKSQIVVCDILSWRLCLSFFQTRFRLWSSIQMLLLPRLRNWWVTQAWILST